MKPNVLLLESITEDAYNMLAVHTNILTASSPTKGSVIARKNPIAAIVTRGKGAVNAGIISDCKGLKIIARCGVGLDNVDVPYASSQGIRVVNAPGSNSDTVVEQAIALLLMLQRQLFQSVTQVKEGNWNYRKQYQGDEIRGKVLGVLGLGNIGRKVATIAAAFGMKVIYWDRSSTNTNYVKMTLEQVLKQADIVSIHLPLTAETQQLIGAKELALMKHTALLINTARGAIIDQTALLSALQNKTVGGFAADVLTIEPPAPNHPLLALDNVLVTPHAASLTASTYNQMCVMTVQNVVDFLTGRNIEERFIFNREVFK